jgi:hypothetical protein
MISFEFIHWEGPPKEFSSFLVMFNVHAFSVNERHWANKIIVGRVENCCVRQHQSEFRVEWPSWIFKRGWGIPNLFLKNKTTCNLIWFFEIILICRDFHPTPLKVFLIEFLRITSKNSFRGWTCISVVCWKTEMLTLGWVVLKGNWIDSPGLALKFGAYVLAR